MAEHRWFRNHLRRRSVGHRWLGFLSGWNQIAYDLAGRVISVTTPDNAVVNSYYNANQVLVRDQAGKERMSQTNALGQLSDVWEITSADAATEPISFPNRSEVTAGYRTRYEYDTLGNLSTVTQRIGANGTLQTRSFGYDPLSRLTSAANPESGTISYQYDNNGNLTQKTDSRSIITNYVYDALNRVLSRSYQNDPGNTPAVTYSYDPAIANGKGRLSSVSSSISTYTYSSYDAMGRVLAASQTINGQSGSQTYLMSYGYDLAGHVTLMTYPSNHKVNYNYDNAGRLGDKDATHLAFTGTLGDGILVDGNPRTYSAGIIYSSLGGMTKEQFGTTTPVYNKLFYNSRGQLSEIRESTSYTGPSDTTSDRGAIINHYSNNYCGMCGGSNSTTSMTDNNGNLKKQEVLIPNSDTFAQFYTYDALNRLQKVNESRNGAPVTWQQQYVYDRYGNRTIDTDPTHTYGGVNNLGFEIESGTNHLYSPGDLVLPDPSRRMRYDAAGNLTTDVYTGTGQRTYDAENRMTGSAGSQPATYFYDGDGRRVKRVVGSTETWQVYGLGGELLAEYAANANPATPQKEYGYRNGQLLVTADAPPPAPNGYTYQRSITIDHSKVPNTDQSNFPLLISGTYSYLKTVANGGYVRNANGYDVIFTSDSACATKLNHEVETYNAATGAVNYWVKVPSVSHTTSDTAIYMCYGNASITASQENKNGVWDSNFKIVAHLGNGTTLSANDSTSNASHGTITGATAASGGIDGGASFNGSSNTISFPDLSSVGDFTISALVNPTSPGDPTGAFGWDNYPTSPRNATLFWVRNTPDGGSSVSVAKVIVGASGGIAQLGAAISNGNWHWITIIRSGTTAKLYIDGVKTGADITVGSGTFTAKNLRLASHFYSSANHEFLNGMLDEFRVSLTARSADWIKTEYNNQSSPSTFYTISSASGGAPAQLHWLVTDQLGTPRMIFDDSGSLSGVSRHDYLPFGEEIYAGIGGRTAPQGYTLSDNVRQKFTQKERDIETGLDYFLARYYSSTQGRFTSADLPLVDQHTAEPQSWNLYVYSRNNPLRYTDPDGRGILDFLKSETAQKLINCLVYNLRVTNAELAVITAQRREYLISKANPSDGLLYIKMGEEGMIFKLDPRKMTQFQVNDYYEQVNSRDSREFPLTPEMMDAAINISSGAPALKGDEYHPDSVTQRQNTDLKALRERMQSTGREAERLGFNRVVKDPPFNSHGQKVFRDGSGRFLTRDIDGHAGGVWKMFNRAGQRLGTYDANLTRIGN